jgi:hypothetical protein
MKEYNYIFYLNLVDLKKLMKVSEFAPFPYKTKEPINTTEKYFNNCEEVMKLAKKELENPKLKLFKNIKQGLLSMGLIGTSNIAVVIVNMLPLGEVETDD